MKEKVRITIKGLSGGLGDGSGHDQITCITEGTLYHQHDHVYVVYEDHVINAENPIKTTVKIYQHHVDIRRFGDINHHMVFEVDKNHRSHYETPYGVLDLNVHTKKLNYDDHDKGLDLKIQYAMTVNEETYADSFFSLIAECI